MIFDKNISLFDLTNVFLALNLVGTVSRERYFFDWVWLLKRKNAM